MDNKISFWKSQWFNLVVGLVDVGLVIYNLVIGDEFMAALWLISACVWIIMAHIEFNDERIKLLEAKAKKYDALAEEVKAMRELQQTSDQLTDQRLKKLEEKK